MRLLAILSAAFAALGLQAPPAVEPGFTALWNGRDFTDWRIAGPESFRIENGAIVAHGAPGHAFYDGPFRGHRFRDFELKVDVMTRANSNGGIYVMTEFQPAGWPEKGFEVQVNNTYTSDPIKTGSLYQVANINEPPARDDEWFTQHVVVSGDTITVRVNDRQTVSWTQPADWSGARGLPNRRLAPGTIALQAHDPNSTVYYRNIRLKPLE
jgi:hypothetical protein